MEAAKSSLQWPLSQTFQLHTRFLKEGKGTISLGNSRTNLMVSNAPPNALLVFFKILASKKAVAAEGKAGTDKPLSARQRLLSTRPSAFEEISPLTLKVGFGVFIETKRMASVKYLMRGSCHRFLKNPKG